MDMDVVHKITQAIEPSLEAMGYGIVQVKLSEGARRRTLSVMAERTDGVAMSFDDCTEISRTVSALLDVEDPITGAYDLEVCSPGLDRPLTRPGDFERFAGSEAKIETMLPLNGRKRFKGILIGAKEDTIMMRVDGNEVHIPVRNIKAAKLVTTDDTVAGTLKRKKK